MKDGVPLGGEGAGMLGIGRPEDTDPAAGEETRKLADDRTGARRGDDLGALGHTISAAGCGLEFLRMRQPAPDRRAERAHRIGVRIDAGRKVDPAAGRFAEAQAGARQIAAMDNAAHDAALADC